MVEIFVNGMERLKSMRISFWSFLIGTLLLIFGIVGIANEVFQMHINIPWWPIIALLLAIWFLSRAFRK
jgi:uncharacterized membrane protein YdcZ (DUF606 family)